MCLEHIIVNDLPFIKFEENICKQIRTKLYIYLDVHVSIRYNRYVLVIV